MNLFPRPARIVDDAGPVVPLSVSVIVTLFDYAHHLQECLASIAAQTQKQIELVVVDDCSRDGGLNVARTWLEEHKSAFSAHRLIAHTRNMGLPYARNTAFSFARADRVFVMDADNALYPRAVERCMQAMTQSGAAGAYTQLEFFGDRTGLGHADFWSKERFKAMNYVDAMALIAKSAWEKVGGYTQLGHSGWEDYDFWCKFVEHGLSCAFVPEVLCRYRCHGSSMSSMQTNPNAGALMLEMSLRHPWLEFSNASVTPERQSTPQSSSQAASPSS